MDNTTIVFIHGLHENSDSWQEWMVYFEQLGYNCHAPNYPFHIGKPSDLRHAPSLNLTRVSLNDVVNHYAACIENLSDSTPILIGHSMGGLIVQKLIEIGKGSMGICIASAPPKGIFTLKWSFIKSNIGVVNPLRGNSLYCGSKVWFHYAICNTLSREVSDALYEETVVPESRNIPRSSRFKEGKINFNKPHQPLLFIGAEKDHIIPISLNRKNAAAYKDGESITEFKEFKGRSHCICVQENWEEVAQFIHLWISKVNQRKGLFIV